MQILRVVFIILLGIVPSTVHASYCEDLVTRSDALSQNEPAKFVETLSEFREKHPKLELDDDAIAVLADMLISKSSTYGEYLMLVTRSRQASTIEEANAFITMANSIYERHGSSWIPKEARGIDGAHLIFSETGLIRGFYFRTYEDLIDFFETGKAIQIYRNNEMTAIELAANRNLRGPHRDVSHAIRHIESLAREGLLKELVLDNRAGARWPSETINAIVRDYVRLLTQNSEILQRLQHFGVRDIERSGQSAVRMIEKLENVTSLDLSSSLFNTEGYVAAVLKKTKLKRLMVRIDRMNIASIHMLQNLESLELFSWDLSSAGPAGYDISPLGSLSNLRHLGLRISETNGRMVGGESLISKLPKLESLVLGGKGQGFTDQVFKQAVRWTEARPEVRVYIPGWGASNTAVEYAKKHPNLRLY